MPVVAGARSLSKLAQVERQRARARLVAIEHHANEAVGVLVKVVVVRHDEELHVLLLLLEELDHAANVVLVERRVDLVQNEEGRRSEAGRSIAAVCESNYRQDGRAAGTCKTTYDWMANKSANAATVLSPPESCSTLWNDLPGGIAVNCMPPSCRHEFVWRELVCKAGADVWIVSSARNGVR